MKKNIFAIIISTFVTLGLIVLLIQATPSYLMKNRIKVYVQEAGDVNQFYHQQLPDASFEAFVSPSPDLLYSYLVFDISKAALLVEFPIHNDFWVNQMVDDNTDSFAYVSYETAENRPIKIVLFNHNSPKFEAPDDAKLIEAPSETGVFLLRYLVRDRRDLSEMEAIRRLVKLVELKSE